MSTLSIFEKLSSFKPTEVLTMVNLIKLSIKTEDRRITVSLTELQKETGLSRPTVIKALTMLEERGEINYHRHSAGKLTGNKANTYTLKEIYAI